MGLAEIENRSVLEDLVKAPAIADRHYGIVHEDSPDRRGVDVALLYDPRYFRVLGHKSYRLDDPADTAFRTRSQLLVSGILEQDTVHVIVAHWPSRRGGEKRRCLSACSPRNWAAISSTRCSSAMPMRASSTWAI
ncbi:MAG: hypothetical protein IPO12_13745 [Flavobacteriales bacterium]|nr:hypothetical protein [Flavobacteriales bacterium]